jgi:hypothetical protein
MRSLASIACALVAGAVATTPAPTEALSPPCTPVTQGAVFSLAVVPDASHIPPAAAFNFTTMNCAATFTLASVPGVAVSTPCFLYQNYTTTNPGSWDSLTPVGPPQLVVRFSPAEVGTWAFVATVNGTTAASGCVQGVSDPAYKGYVRTSTVDRYVGSVLAGPVGTVAGLAARLRGCVVA